jgi:hypothetical protein
MLLLEVVAPSLVSLSVITPSVSSLRRPYAPSVTGNSRFCKSRVGILLFTPGHHHVKKQPVPTPATDPVNFPIVDLLAHGAGRQRRRNFVSNCMVCTLPTHPWLCGAKQSSPNATLPTSVQQSCHSWFAGANSRTNSLACVAPKHVCPRKGYAFYSGAGFRHAQSGGIEQPQQSAITWFCFGSEDPLNVLLREDPFCQAILVAGQRQSAAGLISKYRGDGRSRTSS